MMEQAKEEIAKRDQALDKGKEARGVGTQAGTTVELAHEARIARQAPWRGIADFDVVAQ